MSTINTYYFDRVRYTLKSDYLDSLIITEPIGWNDDEKEYSRHEQYHGVIAKFSNSLKFIDSGAEYIQLIYDIYGINSEIALIREEKHPKTDMWTLTYSGYLDLSTWRKEGNKVTVKFNSGGIEQLLKSRESERIEIDRELTIDGKALSPLVPINVELDGRSIFLKSKWKTKDVDKVFSVRLRASDDENPRDLTYHTNQAVPLDFVNKSHEEASNASLGAFNFNGDVYDQNGIGRTNSMFFYKASKSRTLDLNMSIELKAVAIIDKAVNWSNLSLRLNRYNSVNNRIESLTLYSRSRDNGVANFSGEYSKYAGHFNWDNYPPVGLNYAKTFNLNQGDSLALEIILEGDYDSYATRDAIVRVNVLNCEVTVEEKSFHEKTNTKAILAHEIGDRLVNITTNKEKAFYSEFLGRKDIGYKEEGKASLTSCTHGFWVRGFDKSVGAVEDNLFKPLTTSFKDYVSSMAAVWNIGIGIENVGLTERVRLEELSYFYNKNVTIKLPNQVKNLNRNVATNRYYSSLEFGYELGGSYEEACGLDEYNAKSNFTTVINRLKNTYSQISKYRADSYGMEFARRKQRTLNDTEDTPYDSHIFFMDLKKELTGIFKQRKWRDDFDTAPTGVFSPETATNLRFSPINCLLRHSWWFSGGFKKYLSDKIRYGSSTANSQLKTKLKTSSGGDGNEYAENGDVLNSQLPNARFFPEEIEFEHTCDFDVMQQVNGFTTILGKKIPNFYGLVEFINEEGEIERGFLMNLKPNGKGHFKILKVNR